MTLYASIGWAALPVPENLSTYRINDILNCKFIGMNFNSLDGSSIVLASDFLESEGDRHLRLHHVLYSNVKSTDIPKSMLASGLLKPTDENIAELLENTTEKYELFSYTQEDIEDSQYKHFSGHQFGLRVNGSLKTINTGEFSLTGLSVFNDTKGSYWECMDVIPYIAPVYEGFIHDCVCNRVEIKKDQTEIIDEIIDKLLVEAIEHFRS